MAPMRRIKIHWAWVPAAVFFGVVGWIRYGPVIAVLAILVGLGVGLWAQWRAQRRRDRTGQG